MSKGVMKNEHLTLPPPELLWTTSFSSHPKSLPMVYYKGIMTLVREKPVKSLGRLSSIPLTDRHRGTEVQKLALKGLKSNDKTCLPGKMKAWCYQHGLLPRLLWPLQMYEIVISRVERIQQYSNKYLRKWLGVPPCFSKVGLYTNSGNLQLPIYSLVEEFKIGKVRLYMIMKDSADEIIRKVYPEINQVGSGRPLRPPRRRNVAYESKTS